MKYTRKEWEEILQDSGVPGKSARQIAPNLKQRVEEKEMKRKLVKKPITESKDITEPSNTYIKEN